MHQIDTIAHVIQLAIAPVFLLSGVISLLNVLSGRLARVVDRARILEALVEQHATDDQDARRSELQVLARRGRLIYRAMSLGTTAALLVGVVIILLFGSAITHYSISIVVGVVFITAMLALVAALIAFLREVFFAIETFEVGIAPSSKIDPPLDSR